MPEHAVPDPHDPLSRSNDHRWCSVCSSYQLRAGFRNNLNGTKIMCRDCWNKAYFACYTCGRNRPMAKSKEFPITERHRAERGLAPGTTKRVCADCIVANRITCALCEAEIYRNMEFATVPGALHICSYASVCRACYENRCIHRCSECGTQQNMLPAEWERIGRLCSVCRARPKKLLSDSFTVNPFKRTVGIELEYVYPEFMGHHAPNLSEFGIIKDDGSVRPLDKQKGRPIEFNSHITNGDRALNIFHSVCCKLRRHKAFVNKSCGFHVHLGMRDTVPAQRDCLLRWWRAFEGCIFAFVPITRHTGDTARFCKSIEATAPGDRYGALNVYSFDRHGTFEVRLHSGTCDPEKVNNWVMFLLYFFEHGINTPVSDEELLRIRRLAIRDRMIEMFRVCKIPLGLRKYLLSRARKFAHFNFEKATEPKRAAGIEMTRPDGTRYRVASR